MPDYGDERGFRSRGVPADIGFDRAGPGRMDPLEGYRPGDVTMSNVPFDPRSTFNRSTPIQTGGSRGEFAPPLYSGRNPFIQPIQTGGRLGEFGGMGGAGRLIEGGPFGEWKYGTPQEVTPMDSGSYGTAYMEPHPFPFPGGPFPKPRPGSGGPFDGPWGPFVGEPEGGEFDVAQADFNWRTWQKLKEKFGQGSADQYMESFNVNRGGIMGVI